MVAEGKCTSSSGLFFPTLKMRLALYDVQGLIIAFCFFEALKFFILHSQRRSAEPWFHKKLGDFFSGKPFPKSEFMCAQAKMIIQAAFYLHCLRVSACPPST